MINGYDLPGAVRELLEQRKFAQAAIERLRESRRKMIEGPLAVSEFWAADDDWVADAEAIMEED